MAYCIVLWVGNLEVNFSIWFVGSRDQKAHPLPVPLTIRMLPPSVEVEREFWLVWNPKQFSVYCHCWQYNTEAITFVHFLLTPVRHVNSCPNNVFCFKSKKLFLFFRWKPPPFFLKTLCDRHKVFCSNEHKWHFNNLNMRLCISVVDITSLSCFLSTEICCILSVSSLSCLIQPTTL